MVKEFTPDMANSMQKIVAGIYDIGVDKESGKQHATFSIITIVTDPLTDYIHNTKYRMPVIFVIQR